MKKKQILTGIGNKKNDFLNNVNIFPLLFLWNKQLSYTQAGSDSHLQTIDRPPVDVWRSASGYIDKMNAPVARQRQTLNLR